MKLPGPGLYRTTAPRPEHESTWPAGVLVYVGRRDRDDAWFVVRPHENRRNRWFWQEPTAPLDPQTDADWAATLMPLPAEGYYTLPEELSLDAGGRWLRNAIVQLGYNSEGRGILFVAELRESEAPNALFFSERGVGIDDGLLGRLNWAPILPVAAASPPPLPPPRPGLN